MAYIYFLITVLISTLFLFVRHRYSYWKVRNVPHVEPVFPLGNLNGLKSLMMIEELNYLYTKFKCASPIAGLYLFFKPAVVALDLDLIKSILIKDFPVFSDRLFVFNATYDPLLANLFVFGWQQVEKDENETVANLHIWKNEVHVSYYSWSGGRL